MSARLVPVGWTRAKLAIDAVAAVAVAAYLLAYIRLAPLLQSLSLPPDDNTVSMRATGSCALLLLTCVLGIGPLARLDPRFLSLLYNRRHLGVLTCVIAAAHVQAVLGWYFAYSAVPPVEAMLAADPGFLGLHGIPFIPFGLLAFLLLLVLAATSHDFWLAFLTPPVWKAIHMSVYAAYAAAVLHVALGALRATADPTLAMVLAAGLGSVTLLHLAAASQERRRDAALAPPAEPTPWLAAGPADAVPEGGAIVVHPPGGEAVAIFRHQGRLSAVSNLCAHQNGPLGEGRVVDGCITCPWHGFQYRLEDGCAPPPYTEKLATYRLALRDGMIALDPRPNPPGTLVEPLAVPVSAPSPPADFFVGWQAAPPRALRPLLAALALFVPLGFGVLGLALGRAADDPGAGAFDWTPLHLPGTATARPYPLLHLANGHTLMLTGLGKSGIDLDPALDGVRVAADGVLIRRGTLDMLQVDALAPAEGPAAVPPTVPLGRWRLTGEICDGKCDSGAMRPGSGLAHRACAMLCLAGGVPPVFVTAGAVQGVGFLLLAGADGGPIPASLRALTALRVEIEGTLERIGDLVILRADPDRARLK
jgi:nitrite reductase/ring-hydroxylating ferredoxin subunit/DMSO/TMAO reductase YedYZ heme-binding membrane subunit